MLFIVPLLLTCSVRLQFIQTVYFHHVLLLLNLLKSNNILPAYTLCSLFKVQLPTKLTAI